MCPKGELASLRGIEVGAQGSPQAPLSRITKILEKPR